MTKAEFKKLYFDVGGGRGGWDSAEWQRAFEIDPRPGMRFLVEDPLTKDHTQMWIVTDYGANEHRMFFRTDEESDSMLEFPST